ncbi:MAG TPA: MFS transporter [Phototrophicaceae bacterium]|nr:MFS transporter [Phototrophicaceae bacterium]
MTQIELTESAETASSSGSQRSLVMTVALLTLARIMVNAARRFTYPFVPEISRELGVPQVSVQNVVGLQAGIGVTSPAFGPLAERYGRKRVMIGALLLMGAAALVGASSPTFAIFFPVLLLFGVGKMIFDPAMGAYIGDRVPYHRRGMAFGVMELAWAGSLIVAALGVGWLLDVASLQMVFVVLAVGLVLSAVIVAIATPADHRTRQPVKTFNEGDQHETRRQQINRALKLFLQNRAAVACVGYSFLIALANEILFINYGEFMESSFGLKLTALGLVTVVIALAEAGGEFLVIGAADRFGKRRMALIAAVIASLTYAVLPMLTSDLTLALISLFVMFLAVETSIVAAIPIYSEVIPEARSVMFSITLGGGSLGRLAGSVVGGRLYSLTGSFMLLGFTSLIIGLLAAGLMWRFVTEHHQA